MSSHFSLIGRRRRPSLGDPSCFLSVTRILKPNALFSHSPSFLLHKWIDSLPKFSVSLVNLSSKLTNLTNLFITASISVGINLQRILLIAFSIQILI
ncbi:hypothetical protein ACHQM5_012898 [Ranunculus cassubicifolius]